MAGRTAKTAQTAKAKAKTRMAKTKAKPKSKAKSTKSASPSRAPAKRTAKSAAVKKAPAKKAVAKKKTVKKAPAKKAPVKKAPVKKVGAKKAPAKKAAVKKAPVKKAPAKKAVAKKAPAKKSAAKKPAPKKSAAKKSAAKKSARKPAVARVVTAQRKIKKASTVQLSAFDAKVLAELGDLAKVIRDAKREIRQIRPDDVKKEYLPKAADELDAVVEATADATNTIMDACEIIEGVMGGVDADVSNALMDATTRIYEACTFQDITGQRITKVVGTMKHIEERIDALVAAFGGAPKGKGKAAKKAPAKKTPQSKEAKKAISDADLLEGPQLGGNAKSQAEIDDLLASFD